MGKLVQFKAAKKKNSGWFGPPLHGVKRKRRATGGHLHTHTGLTKSSNLKNAAVFQSQVHVLQSGVSIMYSCFDDVKLENTKAINKVIQKCSM